LKRKQHLYHVWDIKDLCAYREQVEDQLTEMRATVMRDGLATKSEMALFRALARKWIEINVAIKVLSK